MKKFYVRSADNKSLFVCQTPLQAAMFGLEGWLKNGMEYVDGEIVVSERGFDEHDDEQDFVFTFYDVLMLVRRNNKYVRDSQSHKKRKW